MFWTRTLNQCVVGVLLFSCALSQSSRDEAKEDPFADWLEKDVVYLVSEEEKGVFEKLTTEDEKLAFIEQFWRSRDPNPETANNEFRDEHFRRVAYANEKFGQAGPGWKSDRGMVYIKFGPPDRKESRPTGGRVFRTPREIQASDRVGSPQEMTAMPFEVWEYRYIPSIGQEVAFEFVSKDGSPDYDLVMSSDDKDALFFNTGSHIVRQRGRHLGLQTFGGSNLDRLEKYAAAFKPLPAQVSQEFVSAKVRFSEMPFSVEYVADFVDGESVCDVAVLVPHSSLSFNREIDVYKAEVALEILARDIRKIVVAHREESLGVLLPKSDFARASRESSVYRTRFSLPPGRYLLEVWIKDVLGDAASFQDVLAVIPKPESSLPTPKS